MQLPDSSIGISDILAYHDCPRRFSYGMKRHTGIGLQSDDQTPEAGSYSTWYGSAVHHAMQRVEEGYSDPDAIQDTWNVFGRYLNPSDLHLLAEDLVKYHDRDMPNTRTVMNEDELRVPLFKEGGVQYYFRARIDRLYERLDAPGTFIHKDYKSSRHAKSAADVAQDPQMWAYNWALHEWLPEIDSLLQVYDQLRYGQEFTRKTEKQRQEIRAWLEASARAILLDEDVQGDGLLMPSLNKWCAYCALMESCPVIPQLTEFATLEVDTLTPTVKSGRKSVIQIDPNRLEEYLEVYGQAKQAQVILKRFVEAVNELIKAMPETERTTFGFSLKERGATRFSETALRELHATLGPDFYAVVGVTKTALDKYFGDDKQGLEDALELGVQVAGATMIQRK